MKARSKFWIKTAICLMIAGVTVFMGAFAMLKFDFSMLDTRVFSEGETEITERFENISISVDTAVVRFERAASENCRIEYLKQEKATFSAEVTDGVLNVEMNEPKGLMDQIGLFIKRPRITVFLPNTQYGCLKIRTSTGDVEIPEDFSFGDLTVSGSTGDITCHAAISGNIEIGISTGDIDISASNAESIKLKTSTGDIKIAEAICKNISARSSTGGIRLTHVVAMETLVLENSTGGVRLDGCDSGEITIKTSTGNVNGSLLSGKAFSTSTSTGRISVPDSIDGGVCKIKTSTGNVSITIAE